MSRDPATTPHPALEVQGLTVSYRGTLALEGVDLSVEPGERIGVIGPNGAGKSTLLRAVVGLVRASDGRVRIGGQPAPRARRDVAYLPQRQQVDWDHPAQVRDVVAMGRYPRRGPVGLLTGEDREMISQALERVGLHELARRRVRDLSGGQQQRMMLARVLAQQAKVLLLDEPYAALDAASSHIMDRQLSAAAAGGAAVVVVNHDLSGLAGRYDRILVLGGAAIACGPPARVLTREVLDRAYGLGAVPLADPRLGDARLADTPAPDHGVGDVREESA
jgi:ABC-type Mn2+/Zn2+ transport system ATPase subunit